MEEQLKLTLSQAIDDFNNNRTAILQLAFNTGGQDAVIKLEQEYDSLHNSYIEILKKQLDKNNHLYEQLISSANEETERLRVSVNQLNNINEITELATTVINSIGRILIVLGV